MSRAITHLVIHCSASPNGRDVSPEEIDRWHQARGFERRQVFSDWFSPALKHVGYHFIITRDGVRHVGRHVNEIGAHVQGSNARSIGICLVGTDTFTREQWDALADLVRELRVQYPDAAVLGHRDFSPDQDGDGIVEPWEWVKTCPGFEVTQWMAGGMRPLAATET